MWCEWASDNTFHLNQRGGAVKQSTKSSDSRRPRFPLWAHKASGRWCKKRGGKFLYFQKVADDPDGTISLGEWADFQNGRGSQKATGGKALTLRDLVNEWLTTKRALLASDELVPPTFKAYYSLGAFLLETLGKHTLVADLGRRIKKLNRWTNPCLEGTWKVIGRRVSVVARASVSWRRGRESSENGLSCRSARTLITA